MKCYCAGDPQTAVSHLGDVVLFVQYSLAKFKASWRDFFFAPFLLTHIPPIQSTQLKRHPTSPSDHFCRGASLRITSSQRTM